MRIKQINILYDCTHLVLLAVSSDWLLSKPWAGCGTKTTVGAEYVHNIDSVSHVNGIVIRIMGPQSFSHWTDTRNQYKDIVQVVFTTATTLSISKSLMVSAMLDK